MKKCIYSIMLIIFILISTFKVYANDTVNIETTTDNIEEMSYNEIRELSNTILNSTLDNNVKDIKKYGRCFTNEQLTKICDFIANNDIKGTVQSMIVDFVHPKYSSTGDSVLLINAKIQISDYNELYLFEFHINADGKIYGYNVWAY